MAGKRTFGRRVDLLGVLGVREGEDTSSVPSVQS
jgi:hypothetical protein